MAATTEAPPAAAGRLPGDPSMWVFVLGDLVIFSVYFVIFMIDRHRERDLFLASQHQLSPGIAVVNTLLLLASSRLVALAVRAAHRGEHEAAVRRTVGAGLCGAVFVLLKAVEWTREIRRGLTLPKNDFFMFYYMLTGVHLFHVLLGLGILGIVVRELRTPRPRRVAVVESGALYWHLVDLLWIVIFALVYLLR